MNAYIQDITNKIAKYEEKLTKYNKALVVLQEVCTHSWIYDGHGHNDSYYHCSECGKEKSE